MRPARAEDKAAVLAFCAHTWDWGDYLGWVWDAWLADPRGMLAVATLGDQVIGVDKLTFLSPDEAFFEGLRVDPAYRGRGVAGRLEEAMLAEAARQGAHMIRLLTAVDNTPVHKNALRHGFQRGPALLSWQANPGATPGTAPESLAPLMAGPAADAAWAALPHSPLWALLAGCISAHWHAQAWTPALWAAWLAAGHLWAAPGPAGATPPGLVALLPPVPDDTDAWLAWLTADPWDAPTLAALATGVRAVAAAAGAQVLRAQLPSDPALDAGLTAAGWTSAGPTHALLLFEKTLPS